MNNTIRPKTVFALLLVLTLSLLATIQAAPLNVQDVQPAANTHTAPPDTDISITYESDVDATTVTTDTFVVHGMQTGRLAGSYSVSGGQATFTSEGAFKPGERVASSATDDIQLTSGDTMTPTVWHFQTAVAEAPATFEAMDDTLGNADSRGVALGDLDGDGDVDLLSATVDGGNRVWLNNGAGSFTDSGQSLGSGSSFAVVLGDLDGDGDLDAFVGNDGANRAWLNDGAGTFTDSGEALGDAYSRGAALGDVDGDGDLDTFTANQFAPNRVWVNDGSGTFTDSGQTLGSDTSWNVVLADVDGDFDLDAFVANSGADRVWLNDGSGAFADSGQALGATGSWDLAMADVDGDADPDAFVVGGTAPPELWLNDGMGAFTQSAQDLGELAGLAVALGDLDGDGDVDAFVVNNDVDTNQQVWLNDGTGTFGVGDTPAGASSGTIALADLDGDEDLDALAANTGANPVWRNQDSSTPAGPSEWQRQTLDVRGEVGKFTSLALDADDNPHVSYYDETNGDLKYGYWDSMNWQFAVVDSDGDVGRFTSLALGADGRPHVSYHDDDAGALKYARRNDTAWEIETVDDSADEVGLDTSLALDSSGVPHISYYDVSNEALKYAVRAGGSWTTEIVDDDGTVGWYTSLALDAGDVSHITYYDADNLDLKYATRPGAGWQIETVDSEGNVGQHTSLALDENGSPHVSYVEYVGDGVLKYAAWNGAGWQIETVDEGTDVFDSVGFYNSLALAGDGTPHVSYHDANNGALKYASGDGDTWTIEFVDSSGGRTGQYTSLALDGADRPYVGYFDEWYDDLRVAARVEAWQMQTIDDSGYSDLPVLAFDDGRPAISYHSYDGTPAGLNLATWQTEDRAWDVSSIASIGPGDSPSSLRFDDQSRPHVSYYDPAEGRLVYTTRNGGTWDTEIVERTDDSGEVSRTNYLFLADDTPIVVYTYWNYTLDRLRLAEWTGSGWEYDTNDAGPALTAVGRFSAARRADGTIVAGYYNPLDTELRLATWDGLQWVSDESIDDGSGDDVGSFNAVAVGSRPSSDGAVRQYLGVAYYDATNEAIEYAYQTDDGWQNQTAATVGEINSLTLHLVADSHFKPRIAYGVEGENALRVLSADGAVWQQTWTWTSEVVESGGSSAPADVALAFDDRERLAYRGAADELAFAFRTAEVLPPAPAHAGSGVGSETPYGLGCLCLIFPLDCGVSTASAAWSTTRTSGPMNDSTVLAGLTDLFSASPAGQRYVDLYVEHFPELRDLVLRDPLLLWDSYRAMQNFMPGLEALVTGRGDEVVVTQELVDQALDIWRRLADAGSTELADAINEELAAYNDLEDFVGMTFDEWWATVDRSVYLPVIVR